MQIRVQMTLPIVPQPPGVIFEIRACNARTFKCQQGFTAIKASGVIDKLEQVRRQTQVFQQCVAGPLHRRQRHQALGDGAGNKSEQSGIDE